MSKVTSKLQVTIPKAIAEQYGVEPGTEVTFEAAGDAIRVRIGGGAVSAGADDREWRLRLFDAATRRQKQRDRLADAPGTAERGWTREELYGDRGVPR